jgi:hypothetical protein
MIPSVGKIVHLKLSAECATKINQERNNISNHYFGNSVSEGDIFPIIITRMFDKEPTEKSSVNGQVFLDGNFIYWASSVVQGTENGTWHDPRGE